MVLTVYSSPLESRDLTAVAHLVYVEAGFSLGCGFSDFPEALHVISLCFVVVFFLCRFLASIPSP